MTPEQINQQVDELLSVYLDLPPTQQMHFLARIENEQPAEIRAKLLDLLRSPSAEALRRDWQGPLAVVCQALVDEGTVYPVGSRVGQYRIDAVLGRGGMGIVYLAEASTPRRLVALKMILPRAGAVDPTSLARFQHEADAVGRLQHPHIVQVFGWEAAPSGAPVLVLEYVSGGSLEERLKGRRLPVAEAVQLVAILGRAVQAAHDASVVHRDLKPGNVLMAAEVPGSSENVLGGFPKVADFGLARLAEDEKVHTVTDTMLGSPPYMSPEQAAGRSDIGPAVDVWALGVILYRCLSGDVPFKGDCPLATLEQIRTNPVPALSGRVEGVPAELESICLRCLDKDPLRRPTAAELAALLERFTDTGEHPVVLAEPASTVALCVTPPKVRFWFSYNSRAALAMVAVGCVAGVVILSAVLALIHSFVWQAGRQNAPIQTKAATPYEGWIDVVMSRPGDPLRQWIRLDNPASRPLRTGDMVRVKAKLNRAAYLYAVWINTEGQVAPVYPWLKGGWKQKGDEKLLDRLDLPDEPDGQWKMDAGPPGMETLLLLVRETPLPEDVDLTKLLGGLGPQKREKVQDLEEVGWFENYHLVTADKRRGPILKQIEKSKNPMLRLQVELRQRLSRQFAYAAAVSFGNRGGK